MRITQSMLSQTALDGMQTNLLRLSKTQLQASTTKRVNKPEDDPFAVERSLGYRAQIQAGKATLANIGLSNDWLSASDKALGDMSTLLNRAKSLALQGANDSMGVDERGALAAEVDGLVEEAVAIANTQHGDHYLFSGFQISTRPFEYDSATSTVTYNGDNGLMMREAEPGSEMSINVSDETLFTDVFSSLTDLRDALQTDPFVHADVETVLADFDTQNDRILDVQAAMGTKARRLENTTDRIEASQLSLKTLLSNAEDADMAQVVTDLQQQQYIYQAALSVNGQVLRTSLLDYLG